MSTCHNKKFDPKKDDFNDNFDYADFLFNSKKGASAKGQVHTDGRTAESTNVPSEPKYVAAAKKFALPKFRRGQIVCFVSISASDFFRDTSSEVHELGYAFLCKAIKIFLDDKSDTGSELAPISGFDSKSGETCDGSGSDRNDCIVTRCVIESVSNPAQTGGEFYYTVASTGSSIRICATDSINREAVHLREGQFRIVATSDELFKVDV